MKPELFELNASFVGSFAGFVLSIVIGIYLVSLPQKNRESRLFISQISLMGLYYGIASMHNLTIDHDLLDHTGWFHTLILCVVSVYVMWFTYQFGGNPFRTEGNIAVLIFFLITAICFVMYSFDIVLDDATFVPPLVAYIWIIIVFRRKANSEKLSPIPSIRKVKMFLAFQWWGLSCFFFWLLANLVISGPRIGLYLDIEWNYYIVHPLLLFSTIYSAIIFLNYTEQPTSFQAKLVGFTLASLLIFLGLTPIILTRMVQQLPGNAIFVQQMVKGFVILIPVTTALVVVFLPMFLRYSLLAPLTNIQAGFEEVRSGNMSVQLAVDVNDEIGAMTNQFNQMSASLLRYSQEMETLVALRTEELSESLETLRNTQSQLVQKEKMAGLGELVAGVAHEIQNPLNFVNNFAEVSIELSQELAQSIENGKYEQSKHLSTNLRDNMHYIAQSGRRASSIVRSMLDHSRFSTDVRQQTDLNQFVEMCVQTAFQDFTFKNPTFNCRLLFDLDPALPKIDIVVQEINRVLQNLFNNAFYALHQKQFDENDLPTLTVKSTIKDGNVELVVKDNGNGIGREDVGKIFHPFFTTKPAGEGTGLGLSLSHEIIAKLYGGKMSVESVPDQYTVFKIYLPVISMVS